MRSTAKFVLGCVVLLSVLVGGASLVQAAGGTNPEIQLPAAQVLFLAHSVAGEFPDDYASFSHSACVFIRGNATTARLQFEGMENSVPSLAVVAAWLPGSTSNLARNGAKNAARAAANNAPLTARKIPVANGAEHPVAALPDSIKNASLSF